MRIIVTVMTSFLVCTAVAQSPSSVSKAIEPAEKQKIYFPEVEASLYPYEAESYKLAYETFLAKGDLKSAYIVAFVAVKQKPLSKDWRERLAKVAIWYSKPRVALDQYLELIFKLHDNRYLNSALELADKLNAWPLEEKLWNFRMKQGPLSVNEKYRYADLQDHIGNVNQSINSYSELFQKTKKPEDLLHIAEMEYSLGNVVRSRALLRRLVQANTCF